MKKFDLYCIIFYALDSVWDITRSENLGNFLSSANPFLFVGNDSADPSVYSNFNKIVPEKIEAARSFEIAKRYIHSLNNAYVSKAFDEITEDEWNNAVSDYLSSRH